jgi:hypothetical protein
VLPRRANRHGRPGGSVPQRQAARPSMHLRARKAPRVEHLLMRRRRGTRTSTPSTDDPQCPVYAAPGALAVSPSGSRRSVWQWRTSENYRLSRLITWCRSLISCGWRYHAVMETAIESRLRTVQSNVSLTTSTGSSQSAHSRAAGTRSSRDEGAWGQVADAFVSHRNRWSSSTLMPTSARIPRSVPLATSRPWCTGTVVPRPSACRMMWWLPRTRATFEAGSF